MMMRRVLLLVCVLGGMGASFSRAEEAPAAAKKREPRRLPGMQVSGDILLPSQWSLKPAGKQLVVGDFPVNIALHPTSAYAVLLHAGFGEHGLYVVDLKQVKVVSQATIPQTFYGVCFSPDGTQVFASGAEFEVIHQFQFEEGYLSKHREIKIGELTEQLVPCGLSCTPDGKSLLAALAWGEALAVIPLAQPDKITRIDFPKDSYPYLALPTPDSKRAYVSLWGEAKVAVVNLETNKVEANWSTDSHPTEMLLSPNGKLLYVSCANSNHVNVLETDSGKVLEVMSSALYAQAPNGSTPNSISLSADGQILVVANADNNNVAVFNVSEPGHAKALGHIPVGWYPTSVRISKQGTLFVANGKGIIPKSNRQGPNPLQEKLGGLKEYIGGLYRGTLSSLPLPNPTELSAFSKQARECSPLKADKAARAEDRTADNPIPAKIGDPSPIKHCIYIIKENRTYDQVLGDMPEGNGDPSLCIFPEKVTPNHHALAREFVLLDNFYVEGEVSADGHEWSMAAYATDFVEKSWPLNYRGSKGKITYPSEGKFPISFPSGGYIWDKCKEAGVSYRSYGEFVGLPGKNGEPAKTKVPSLEGHFDPFYHSYDLDYPDVKRVARFAEELKNYEKNGGFPSFIVLRLPNDHTYGTRVGKPTPTAMVAENDFALGQLIELISHSKFWPETAIFIVEDDAQNGSDHVDAHRTIAFVVSPYTKRKFVDSSMYSTSSMLRSMELILGLQPMSQFDAAALPMYASFTAKPDLTPFQPRPANVDINAVNVAGAWGAELSEELDLSREDAADDLIFNEIIWRSVKGPNSRMPAPVRASFVLVHPEDEEEEDEDDEEEEEREREEAARRPKAAIGK